MGQERGRRQAVAQSDPHVGTAVGKGGPVLGPASQVGAAEIDVPGGGRAAHRQRLTETRASGQIIEFERLQLLCEGLHVERCMDGVAGHRMRRDELEVPPRGQAVASPSSPIRACVWRRSTSHASVTAHLRVLAAARPPYRRAGCARNHRPSPVSAATPRTRARAADPGLPAHTARRGTRATGSPSMTSSAPGTRDDERAARDAQQREQGVHVVLVGLGVVGVADVARPSAGRAACRRSGPRGRPG